MHLRAGEKEREEGLNYLGGAPAQRPSASKGKLGFLCGSSLRWYIYNRSFLSNTPESL